MMSTEAEEVVAADTSCCASCGKAAIDDVKLKNCACGLVKYCTIECQKNHRPQHKTLCKKRLAELRDIELFTPPDGSNWGECPICCLPLSLDERKSRFMGCCSKIICIGCDYANQKRETMERLEHRCAFCREPMPKTQKESLKRAMKRIKENNDPAATCQMGNKYSRQGDYESALEYWAKAAKLGNADAHYQLSCAYRDEVGVEKDMKQAIYHLEEAAIAGHHWARHNLGCEEANNGSFERARKHFIIAANLGHDDSLKCLRQLHADGYASKEDYANALRAYQAAVDATKSSDREKAESLARPSQS